MVRDVRDNTPVADANLTLGNAVFGAWSPDTRIAAVATGPDGRFALSSVPPGSYLLRVTPPAPLLPEFWPNVPIHPAYPDTVGYYGLITVRDGEIATADFEVAPPGSLGGRVTRASDGQPLANVTVTARWASSGYFELQVATLANGDYLFPTLPPGSFRVSTDADSEYLDENYDDLWCGSACVNASFSPVEVSPEALRSGIDFSLSSGARLAGTIRQTGQASLPISTSVQLLRHQNGTWNAVRSVPVAAGASSFIFDGLEPGLYSLETRSPGSLSIYDNEIYDDHSCEFDSCSATDRAAATPIAIAAGQTFDQAVIELDPAASIAGCVTDATNGSPLPGIDVILYDYVPLGFGFGHRDERSARTGADGCYSITHLPTLGSSIPTRLRTFNDQGRVDEIRDDVPCLGGNCSLELGTMLSLAHDEDLTGLDFALAEGASVFGRVRAWPDGPAIGDAAIEIYLATGESARPNDGKRLRTQADGRFRSYALVNGTYHLLIDVAAGRWAGRHLYNGPPVAPLPLDPTDGEPISIQSGESAGPLEIVLCPQCVLVDGFE